MHKICIQIHLAISCVFCAGAKLDEDITVIKGGNEIKGLFWPSFFDKVLLNFA